MIESTTLYALTGPDEDEDRVVEILSWVCGIVLVLQITVKT